MGGPLVDRQHTDLLIAGGAVITMNAEGSVLDDGALAIQGNRIVAVGPTPALSAQYAAARTIDARGLIVMPGLIDTHFHTGQQFERGMLYYLSKEGKLREPIWQFFLIPFEGALTDEDVYLSALFAYANLLKNGTTCFADAGGPRPELMAPALQETGIRGILAASTLDLQEDIPPEMQDSIPSALDKGERLFKAWHGGAGGRIRIWMAIRQIMVASPALIVQVKELADQLQTGVHTHLAEGTYEVDFAIERYGLRPAEFLHSLGFLAPNVHAAHSILLSERELDLYRDHNVSVGHCPALAFAHAGNTKVPAMLHRGIRVGLGTDGALTGSLDLFRQMALSFVGQVAAFGVPYRDPAPIVPEDLLRLATLGGAQALGWADEIGSLEAGKKADLVLITREDLDVLPSYDPVHTAAYNASARQVRTVVVDGQVVVEDGRLLTVDEAALKERIRERAPQVLARFLERVGQPVVAG